LVNALLFFELILKFFILSLCFSSTVLSLITMSYDWVVYSLIPKISHAIMCLIISYVCIWGLPAAESEKY